MWNNWNENNKWKQNDGLIANLMYFSLIANQKHETSCKKWKQLVIRDPVDEHVINNSEW